MPPLPNYVEATLGAAGLMGITFYPGYNCITPPNFAKATLGKAGLDNQSTTLTYASVDRQDDNNISILRRLR